jgi:hypothetical protein
VKASTVSKELRLSSNHSVPSTLVTYFISFASYIVPPPSPVPHRITHARPKNARHKDKDARRYQTIEVKNQHAIAKGRWGDENLPSCRHDATAHAQVARHAAATGVEALADNGFGGLCGGETFLFRLVRWRDIDGGVTYLLPAPILQVSFRFRPHPQNP